MKQLLISCCTDLGIDQVGIAPAGSYPELAEKLRQRTERGHLIEFDNVDTKRRCDPRLTMPDVQSVIVCLFPYYTGTAPGANLSKYTYSLDYHHIIKNNLEAIGCHLQSIEPEFRFQAYVDTGPLVDRYLAWLAGLGFYGLNSCLINDKYGSWFFIGYLLTNYSFTPDVPLAKTCLQCGRCQESCPGNIIIGDGTIDSRHCKSFLTQKKVVLSPEEVAILQKTDLIWGCDVCQDVCPHNISATITPLREFHDDLLFRVDSEQLAQLSHKQFRQRYGNRAFSWRGKQVLLRNIEHICTKEQ